MALADEARAYQLSLKSQGRQREMGAYYTPDWMVEQLLDQALEPVLRASDGPVHVCDPACGAGAFLVGAARRLRSRGRSHDRLTGIDLDPVALEMVARAFAAEGLPEPALFHADSLRQPPTDVDVFLGNPPFQNAIERAEPSPTLKRFPILGGTADLAFEFLAMAAEAIRPRGRIGFVLPRTVLNAPSAERLRQSLHPRWLATPPRPDYFTGANVFVALVVTGPPGPCETASGIRDWQDANWWRLVQGGREAQDGPKLGERFEVTASMAAGDAYLVRDLLEEDGPGLRLVTTGLIEPGRNEWGIRRCRFLKKDFLRPTLDIRKLSGALKRRAERARRPKIVVAGLSRRLEAYLDWEGKTIGAVSTYAIFHPEDSADELGELLQLLLDERTTDLFRQELGANAMGGGSITLTKAFLNGLSVG